MSGCPASPVEVPEQPGTTLTVHVTWDDAGRRCAAVVSDADGVVARIKLRYEP